MSPIEELSAEDIPIHGLWSEELPAQAAPDSCVGCAATAASMSCPVGCVSSAGSASTA